MNKYILWDKTNIGENYPGVTSPLTYSFVRHAYSNVYVNFVRLIGARPKEVEKKKYIFENLIGQIQGQLYYNLMLWYELLDFLPAKKNTTAWFDAMLDPVVKADLKNIANEKHGVWVSVQKMYIGVRFVLLSIFFPLLHQVFEFKSRKLFRQFQNIHLETMSQEKLGETFDTFQSKFFSVWAITIVNDFRLMSLYGILTKMVHAWTDNPAYFLQQLKNSKHPPVSVRVLQDALQISQMIRTNDTYKKLFEQHESKQIIDVLKNKKYAPLSKLIDTYLANYGDRMASELKLEEPSFVEQPHKFIELLQDAIKIDSHTTMHKIDANSKFTCGRLHRWLISNCIFFTIQAMHRREYYRLRRVQAFRLAKQMYASMAKRLLERGVLKNISDVYILTHQEVFSKELSDKKLQSICIERKKIWHEYEKQLLPQLVYTDMDGNVLSETFNNNSISTDTLCGKAASAGAVEGEVVVMTTLDTRVSVSGKILVTKTTDPGWTILFPKARGVITEYGGMLSHAAIVAREIGIPCIVAVPMVTEKLKSGDRICMNGTNGTIERI